MDTSTPDSSRRPQSKTSADRATAEPAATTTRRRYWTSETAPRPIKGLSTGPRFRLPNTSNRWRPGQSGNPKGKPPGTKTLTTRLKIQILAESGMLPLDFLTAVYRDQVYTAYQKHLAPDGRTYYFTPAPGAQKIAVTMDQRITAAMGAAPYVHSRQPVGVQVDVSRAAKLLTAQQLAQLSTEDLQRILEILDRLQTPAAALPAAPADGVVYDSAAPDS